MSPCHNRQYVNCSSYFVHVPKQLYYGKPVEWKASIEDITMSRDSVFVKLPYIMCMLKTNNAGVISKGKVVLLKGTIRGINDSVGYVKVDDGVFSDH